MSSWPAVGVPKFTEKLAKMVTGAKGGPWPSGDGKAVEKLSQQDLYDLDKAVVSLNVISNPAVQECCNKIDEREVRGFLAADELGGELVHISVAPTEAHVVGTQVETLLGEAKVAD